MGAGSMGARACEYKPDVKPPLRFTSLRVANTFLARADQSRHSEIRARIEKKCLFGTLGDDFEDVGIDYISKGGSFRVKPVKVGGERGAVRRRGGGTKQQEKNLYLPTDAKYTEHNKTKDIFKMLEKSGNPSTRKQRTEFLRCPKNFPVADMVTNSGQLLNITINANHDINCQGLARILKAAGICKKSTRKLDMYFCLPLGHRYDTFRPTWTNPKGLEWVKEHIRVHALCIKLVIPIPLPTNE